MIYSKWKKYLDNLAELELIELAGRGKRINEPFYKSIDEAIDDIYPQISDIISGHDYALFGHSMGSVLVYELAYKLINNNKPLPVNLFFSGRCPPYVSKHTLLHKLPDKEFLKSIYELGGIDENFVNNREFIELFLPIIRADYKIVELYNLKKKTKPLDCNITVFNGKKDIITNFEDMKKWCECTSKKCKLYEFDAGHFFINTHMEDIIQIIRKTLITSH